jgi:anti-anti-sigma factor
VTRMDGEQLLISVEKVPGRTMLVVRGEVDLATAAQLRDELLGHLETAQVLWLDLQGVTFMDSSGLHVLIASRRRADLLGTALVIARASAAVDRVLEVTGTTALFARGAKDLDPSAPAMSLGPSTGAEGRDGRPVTSGILEGARAVPR